MISLKKYWIIGAWVVGGAFLLVCWWGIFVPRSSAMDSVATYQIQKGMGYKEIGIDLEKKGFIANHGFFTIYALFSGHYKDLQAGNYEISSYMSVANIVKKFAAGDVVKNTITIIEGWDVQDMADYLQNKGIFEKQAFLEAGKNHEGYLFPDTYQIDVDQTPEGLVNTMLETFDKKLTPKLRQEIASPVAGLRPREINSIFKIVVMASILEEEVQTLEDKKIVAGILYKRMQEGMPLQVDASINYILGKHNPGVVAIDTTIDTPYNTYKYYGLPPGPICSPGIDSIMAAIYPEKSSYWFYLSDPKTQKTIFSKTLPEHNAAARKYLK